MATSNIMRREALMAEKHTEILFTPLLAIRGHLCFRCWLPHSNLKKCSGCKRVAYCGDNCQKIDWKAQHKKDCKKLRTVNLIEERETAPHRTAGLWKESLFQKTEVMKGDKASQNVIQIIISQPHCTTCYRGLFQSGGSIVLKSCAKCQLVFTCTDCPSSHTDNECLVWQRFGDVEIFRISFFNETGGVTPQGPTGTPRETHKALSTASSWRDFYLEISDKQEALGPYVNPDLSLNPELVNGVPTDMRESMKRVSMFFLVATDTMTMPLTIIAALEQSIPDLASRKRLEIHLIGATGREAQHLVLFEEFLHLLPKLETLKLVLVGPRSFFGDGSTEPEREMTLECCPKCTSRGRQRKVSMRQKLYHDYAQTPRFSKPDMAVLFHSGRSQEEEESWLPTTAWLVDSGTLTLCTTYNNREATEEVDELDQLGVKFIKRPEVNPWRSLVPYPEFLAVEEDDQFYYMNNYWYIFKGKERRNIGGLISEGVD